MQTALMLITPLVPTIGGLLCGLLPAQRGGRARDRLVLTTLALTLALVVALWVAGDGMATLFSISAALPVVLRSDALGRLFALMASAMWLLSGGFSLGYFKGDAHAGRFYAFYLLTLGALMGLALSGTLVTMYLFFELTTLLSVPLVMHDMTKQAVAAGVKYLIYSIAGAMMGLLGVIYFTVSATGAVFTPGGMLRAGAGEALVWVLFVTVVGFGTKAGMFPMHGWLPTAHPIAPAPASAVLSGVITKAGVLCVIRVVYYVVGADFLRGTWAQTALLALALVTVFMGSMMALKTTGLKKRLAYSTVSQVSYMLFGLYLLDGVAFSGALMHMVFHSAMKTGLFLCAGALIHQLGKTDARELSGAGRQMPVTMWCFTICGLGLVGVPPFSGFVSKWALATGAIGSGVAVVSWLGPVVLLVSALLTAGYLLPVSIDGFFPGEGFAGERREVGLGMWAPMVALAAMTLLGGVYPSPLRALVDMIASGVM